MNNKWQTLTEYAYLSIGAILLAVSLELILAPNNLVDGGTTALSIMAKHIQGIPTWMALMAMNLPIIFFVSRQLGKRFFYRALYSNIVAIIALAWLTPKPAVTSSEVLIVLYGGLFMGIGVGLVIKNGGAIDGTEMLAVWCHKRFHIPISTFLMAINTLILSVSALVFGIEKTMFSIAVYFIVSKLIDMVLDGINRMFAVFIISSQPQAVGKILMEEGSQRVTYLSARGGYSGEERDMIYCITDRFNYPKLKELVLQVDPTAILEASLVSETEGIKRRQMFKPQS